MFGQIVKNAPQIIEGHFNEITGREKTLSESRISICKQCPLCSTNRLGLVCDSKKCASKETGELVLAPTKGVVCGCGCRLEAKTRLKNAKCVLGKW